MVRGIAAWIAFSALATVHAGAALAAEAPTIRELVEVADIEALSASPDGARVAFRVERASIERNTYQLDWYIADVATGAVRRIADGGAPLYTNGQIEREPAIWAPDGRSVYFRARFEDGVGIWRAAADGSGSRQVVEAAADVESIAPGGDGRTLLYATGPTREEIARAERREYDDGILADATVDLGQAAYRGGWVRGRQASERLIGRWFSRDELLWRAPRTRHRLDLVTLAEVETGRQDAEESQPLRPGNVRPAITATSAAHDLAVATPGENDSVSVEVRRQAGPTISCADPACRTGSIVAIAWRPGRDEVLFAKLDRHLRHSLLAWSPRTGRVRIVAAGEGSLSGSRGTSQPCTYTPAFAFCVTAGPVSPPRLERVDLDRGGRLVLLDPNPELRAHRPAAVERLSWTLPDGRNVTGLLMYDAARIPAGAPLFINYYFCRGFLRGGGTGDRYPMLAMIGAGFVVACLNGVPNAEADSIGRYRDALTAVGGLVDRLARRGLVDPARVGMGGFSFGSEATMWVAMNSNLLAAAAIASGQFEPSMYWMSTVRGRDYAEPMRGYYGVGSPDEDPAGWRRLSPALNAGRIRAPLLMQLPEQEARGSVELYSRLGSTTTPVEMYLFPDEAHLVVQPRHVRATYQRNLDWFRYWLLGERDPDPARAAQYDRWDSLRRRRDESAVERP